MKLRIQIITIDLLAFPIDCESEDRGLQMAMYLEKMFTILETNSVETSQS